MAPLGLLQRLRDYWPYGKATEPPPPLSTGPVVVLSIALTILYVAPFYLSPTTRPSRAITRDSPTVIRARVRAVLLSCAFSTILTVYILSVNARLPYYESLHLLGLYPFSLSDLVRSLALLCTLYAGPLFENLIVEEAWREYVEEPQSLVSAFTSPTGFRNYVAGPFTEELLFRSILIPLNILTPQVLEASTGLAGTHARVVLFTTPLYFGVAHVHHLYEMRLTRPEIPFKFALINSMFQLCFTTIFGWYAAFIFLRTGSLWACFLTHAFCNWVGMPRVWGKVLRPEAKKPRSFRVLNTVPPKPPVAMGPPKDEPGFSSYNGEIDCTKPLPGIKGKKQDSHDMYDDDRNGNKSNAAPSRVRKGSYVRARNSQGDQAQGDSILWTVAYYVILVIGLIGFCKGLWPLTHSSNQLADI